MVALHTIDILLLSTAISFHTSLFSSVEPLLASQLQKEAQNFQFFTDCGCCEQLIFGATLESDFNKTS